MLALQRVIEDLKQDEGFRPSAYQDTEGFWTIGYGTLIDARRGGCIDKIEGEYLLRNRLIQIFRLITTFWFFEICNNNRQLVLVNMAYNLGVGGLLGFRKMIAAIEAKDWERAADEILDSKAARQIGGRYERLAERMRQG